MRLDPAACSTRKRVRLPAQIAALVLLSVGYGHLVLTPALHTLSSHDEAEGLIGTVATGTRWLLFYVAQPFCAASLVLLALVCSLDPGLAKLAVRQEWKDGCGLTPCSVCGVLRPPRSHHCRECDACVVGFDHHCCVLGVCVAAGNQRVFILLLVSGAVAWGLLGWASVLCELARFALQLDVANATLLAKWQVCMQCIS